MMSFGVWFGRVIFAGIWAVLIANIIWPFAGSAYGIFLILTGIVLIMHLLQLGMFVAMYKDMVTWQRGDYLQIIAFGIVGWLAIMQRTNKAKTHDR